MWHRGPKPVTCRYWLFCWIIFYSASASKYFLQNQNISFLTEVILVCLEQSKKWKNRIKCLGFSCVIVIHCNHQPRYHEGNWHKLLANVDNKKELFYRKRYPRKRSLMKRMCNRKLLVSTALTKVKSQEPAYWQVLKQNKIDRHGVKIQRVRQADGQTPGCLDLRRGGDEVRHA